MHEDTPNKKEVDRDMFGSMVAEWLQADSLFIDRLTLAIEQMRAEYKKALADVNVVPEKLFALKYDIDYWTIFLTLAIEQTAIVLSKEDAFAMADINAQAKS
jgi:hypothetical protein